MAVPEPQPQAPDPATPDYYLVASIHPFRHPIPGRHHTDGAVPGKIKITNVVCVIEATSEEEAIRLLATSDVHPLDTRYFAIPVRTMLAQSVMTPLMAGEPEARTGRNEAADG